jgi:hypothetical protein
MVLIYRSISAREYQSLVYCDLLEGLSTHSIMGVKSPVSQSSLCLDPGETLIMAVGRFEFQSTSCKFLLLWVQPFYCFGVVGQEKVDENRG